LKEDIHVRSAIPFFSFAAPWLQTASTSVLSISQEMLTASIGIRGRVSPLGIVELPAFGPAALEGRIATMWYVNLAIDPILLWDFDAYSLARW
jgi:hypothetical protein